MSSVGMSGVIPCLLRGVVEVSRVSFFGDVSLITCEAVGEVARCRVYDLSSLEHPYLVSVAGDGRLARSGKGVPEVLDPQPPVVKEFTVNDFDIGVRGDASRFVSRVVYGADLVFLEE